MVTAALSRSDTHRVGILPVHEAMPVAGAMWGVSAGRGPRVNPPRNPVLDIASGPSKLFKFGSGNYSPKENGLGDVPREAVCSAY